MKISSDEKMADSGTEESSWTYYIQEFICDNDNDDQNSSLSSDYVTSSLVSDAASSAVKKFTDIHRTNTELGFPNGFGGNYDNDRDENNDHMMGRNISIMCKQNSFKKQKTKVPIELQDTASSPANSPKISYMNEFMNHRDKGKADVSEAKRDIFGTDRTLNDHHVEKESNCTDLKERTCDC